MANINSYLITISRGTFGRDVRNAIHDAIEAVNNDLPNSTSIVQEVTEARTDVNGTAHNKLKTRLNSDYNYLNSKIGTESNDGKVAKIQIDNAISGYTSLKDRLDSQFNELSTRLNKVKSDADRAENAALDSAEAWGEIQALAEQVSMDADTVSVNTSAVSRDKVTAVAAKDVAVTAKNTALTAGSNAEAYAVGTRDGVAVTSTDAAYQNNAKYYAEQMAVDTTLSIPGRPADAKKVGDEITDLKGDLSESNAFQKLLHDNIPDTIQSYTFADGAVSMVEHKNGNVVVRSDAFTYGESSITEVRTLGTGESLTIVTNLETLETSVTYATV